MYTKKCEYREFHPHFYNSSSKLKKRNDYNGLELFTNLLQFHEGGP